MLVRYGPDESAVAEATDILIMEARIGGFLGSQFIHTELWFMSRYIEL